jgi:hypothetical protein
MPLLHGGRQPISSHHCPGSFSLAFGRVLLLDSSPSTASSVVWKYPLRPLP